MIDTEQLLFAHFSLVYDTFPFKFICFHHVTYLFFQAMTLNRIGTPLAFVGKEGRLKVMNIHVKTMFFLLSKSLGEVIIKLC